MIFNDNDYLSVYACCLPVKGYRQSIIFDSQRRNYFEVPNSLIELMEMFLTHSIKALYEILPASEHETLDEYIHFLLDNDIAFICEKWELDCYVPMALEWDAPYSITNAIIDCKQYDKTYLDNLLKQLEGLFCVHIQINFEAPISTKELDEIMDTLALSKIKAVEFNIPYQKFLEKADWKTLFKKHLRIFRIIVYGAPQNNYLYPIERGNIVSFIKQEVKPEHCGQIHKGYFTLNQTFFCESQQHNTCLNRKLCIDAEGNIKNCPSMQHSFGNIKDTTLKEAVEKQGFKDLWFIHKGQIEVCKDCEYRHLCSDCRCFIKDSENIYSKPAKCTYNPYIGKWQGEEGYVPVEELEHTPKKQVL